MEAYEAILTTFLLQYFLQVSENVERFLPFLYFCFPKEENLDCRKGSEQSDYRLNHETLKHSLCYKNYG